MVAAIPRFWFRDNATLQQFIDAELRFGLARAVEAMVLDDIAGTSGTQPNIYSSSALQTLRKSVTLLEIAGYDPSAFVVHPTDWETIELALSTANAVEHLALPYDPAARRLYGVPVVVTTSQTTGTGHTLGRGAVGVNTDRFGVGVDWTETSNADDWSKNLIRARCEGRYATSIFAPLGVVESTLTGTGGGWANADRCRSLRA